MNLVTAVSNGIFSLVCSIKASALLELTPMCRGGCQATTSVLFC